MNNSLSTPRSLASAPKIGTGSTNQASLFSSSPGFGTPAYPISERPLHQTTAPLANRPKVSDNQTVLPIILSPQILRPVAFRALTKKHNLTLTTAGLTVIASFIGKFCGSRWREDGLAERILDELAKQWKKNNGQVIIDDAADKALQNLLRSLEPCMSGGRLDTSRLSGNQGRDARGTRQSSDLPRPDASREHNQGSLGFSGLEVEGVHEVDGDLALLPDARSYLTIISAFSQPRFAYSTSKKMLEVDSGTGSLLPPIQRKIMMFRNRFHLVHQRLLRNESFQAPAYSNTFAAPKLLQSHSNVTIQQAYKITPVSNLLGRSGTSHLLLGLLVHTAAGDLALTDLTSSVVLDMSVARPIPTDGTWFCPGMIVLVEGLYEENESGDSSLGSAGGIGGQIKGRFAVDTIASPPAERRDITLGAAHGTGPQNAQVSSAGFGWIDLLGVGSERSVGSKMRHIRKRLLDEDPDGETDDKRTKIIIIAECNLDVPRTIEAIRAVLSAYVSTEYVADQPVSIIFTGNFVSAACMARASKGGGSIAYKEHFDHLANVLSEFPTILANSTLIFVPGDKDPWASSFSAGAATILPSQNIPDLFTSRIKRAVASANTEASKREGQEIGKAVFTSNPARMSFFGPVDEIVVLRDDMSGRLRRNAVMFPGSMTDDNVAEPKSNEQTKTRGDLNVAIDALGSEFLGAGHKATTTPSMIAARKLIKTILDQGHLAPFSTSVRPVLWDYAASLNIHPLPTALVLADAEMPAFAITYEGCHVMNPGRVLDDVGMRKGIAKWMEYDLRSRRGILRDVRF